MAKKYYTAEKLNLEMKKIGEAGFQIPTTMYRIQEGHTRIIISNDLKNAGYIRTYDEAVAFLKRVYGESYQEYTIKQYEQELKSIQDDLGIERTYQGEVRAQRAQIRNIVEDMDKYMGTKTDIKSMTTQDLYNAIKLAGQMVKDSNANSPMFYEYLSDILEGLSGAV